MNFAQRVVLATFAALLVLAPLGDSAASDAPSKFHWARESRQFTVQAGDNYDNDWNKLVQQAASNWNKSDVVTVKVVDGDTSAQNCSPSKGRIEICSFNYGTQEGWLGLTRLYFDNKGEHIESATLQLNDSFFNQNNGKYNSDAARRHTICHEMGHTIGLDHVNTSSCMNDSQSAVFNNLTPINKDYRQLERIYKHKDSDTTLAGNQKSGKGKDKKHKDSKKNRDREDEKKDRRDRKRGDTRARSDSVTNETVTVERLDNGQTVVTFITWAEK